MIISKIVSNLNINEVKYPRLMINKSGLLAIMQNSCTGVFISSRDTQCPKLFGEVTPGKAFKDWRDPFYDFQGSVTLSNYQDTIQENGDSSISNTTPVLYAQPKNTAVKLSISYGRNLPIFELPKLMISESNSIYLMTDTNTGVLLYTTSMGKLGDINTFSCNLRDFHGTITLENVNVIVL